MSEFEEFILRLIITLQLLSQASGDAPQQPKLWLQEGLPCRQYTTEVHHKIRKLHASVHHEINMNQRL